MFNDVGNDVPNPLGRCQSPFPVDVPHLFIPDVLLFFHRTDIIDAERQHILIRNGIHDGVGMQLLTKSLFGGFQINLACTACVHCKNWSTRKSKNIVLFEILLDCRMHLPKLGAVTLVEDDHKMLIE